MSTYRGKYPTKVHTVYGAQGGVVCVLNNGNAYLVAPISAKGRARMPKPGDYLTDYSANDYTFEARQ